MCQRHSKTKKSLQNQSRSAIKTKKYENKKQNKDIMPYPGFFLEPHNLYICRKPCPADEMVDTRITMKYVHS